jgi:putative membrane protein
MESVALVAVGIVAALHLGFLCLEMFLWEKPIGRRVFGLAAADAATTATLAKNQGLYNGFLAAGLIWGMLDNANRVPILDFFLTCIIIAGVYGAMTVNRSILAVQALPAAVALALVLIAF